jgi:hypothetical protein
MVTIKTSNPLVLVLPALLQKMIHVRPLSKEVHNVTIDGQVDVIHRSFKAKHGDLNFSPEIYVILDNLNLLIGEFFMFFQSVQNVAQICHNCQPFYMTFAIDWKHLQN